MTLTCHIKTPLYEYWSEEPKLSPNTYILNSDRWLRTDAGTDGADVLLWKKGTLVTCDMEEVDTDQGWRRVIGIRDCPTFVPESDLALLYAKQPDKQKAQLWVDWSGLSDWKDPEPVEPPPPPEQEVWLVNKTYSLFGYEIVLKIRKL